jgi:hypothetical protein
MSGNPTPNWVLIFVAGIGAAGAVVASIVGLSKPPDKPSVTENPSQSIVGNENQQISGARDIIINNNSIPSPPSPPQPPQPILSQPTLQPPQPILSQSTPQPPQPILSQPTLQPPQPILTASPSIRLETPEANLSPWVGSTHVLLLTELPNKDFVTIIGSYDKQEDAETWGEKIKGENPDLDIKVFVPSKNSDYAVSAAFSSLKEEAMQICRKVRSRGIAKDAYVSSSSNSYMPCD